VDTAEARRTFREVRTASVGSVSADGSPHVVPLWFVWLEDAIYLTCRHGSAVRRNLARDPRVAVSIDRGVAWTEQAGCLVRGMAQILGRDDPGTRRALSAWFEKYQAELSGFGFAAYTEQVAQPVVVRVRPEQVPTWVHAYRPPR
jgi:nitroimidazol reductase NimA-like FMN-containing flavoprotein (pyridoxamine 5'-phosphate oxidase superfamily)